MKEELIEKLKSIILELNKAIHNNERYGDFNIGTEMVRIYLHQLTEAIQALQQRESEWISVEDRLPEPKQFVLVYGILNKEVGKDDTKPSIGLVMWNVPMASDCKDEDQYIMWYTDITHWMPLPTPPNK